MSLAHASAILDRLHAVIEDRATTRPEGSYVVQLLDGGVPAIGAKVLEEAAEVVDAATEGDAAHLAREIADLLFHTWVMMEAGGITPGDVYGVLEERFGLGGLDEKRRRSAQGSDDAG